MNYSKRKREPPWRPDLVGDNQMTKKQRHGKLVKMSEIKPPAIEPQDATTSWDPAIVNYKPIIYGLLLGIPFWGILGLIVTVVKHYIGGG